MSVDGKASAENGGDLKMQIRIDMERLLVNVAAVLGFMGLLLLLDWAVASALNDGRSISAAAFGSIYAFLGGCGLLLLSILFLLVSKRALPEQDAIQEHVYAYSTCCKELDEDGREHDRWSFSSSHSYSWIGRTIGPVVIFFARIRHNRLVARSNRKAKA
jgi:hypothetical protein